MPHDMGVLNPGQALVESLQAVGQAFVIDPQEMENGGIQIADMNRIGGDGIAEVIGQPMRRSALYAAVRHPHAEALRVVIAAVVTAG